MKRGLISEVPTRLTYPFRLLDDVRSRNVLSTTRRFYTRGMHQIIIRPLWAGLYVKNKGNTPSMWLFVEGCYNCVQLFASRNVSAVSIFLRPSEHVAYRLYDPLVLASFSFFSLSLMVQYREVQVRSFLGNVCTGIAVSN